MSVGQAGLGFTSEEVLPPPKFFFLVDPAGCQWLRVGKHNSVKASKHVEPGEMAAVAHEAYPAQ
jgi:hypothetical protein